MLDLNSILLYRMTHVENIPHILKHGITHITSTHKNKKYVPIGDGNLISRRNEFAMANGKLLGNYIPFYFGPKMPMLFVLQRGYNGVTPVSGKDVVYCIASVMSLKATGLDFVFTNGHAVDGLSEFYYPKDLKNIDSIIDKKAITSKYWKDENDLDLKRRKEAEFLVEGDVPIEAIESFAVYNTAIRDSILKMKNYNNQAIIVEPNYYF